MKRSTNIPAPHSHITGDLLKIYNPSVITPPLSLDYLANTISRLPKTHAPLSPPALLSIYTSTSQHHHHRIKTTPRVSATSTPPRGAQPAARSSTSLRPVSRQLISRLLPKTGTRWKRALEAIGSRGVRYIPRYTTVREPTTTETHSVCTMIARAQSATGGRLSTPEWNVKTAPLALKARAGGKPRSVSYCCCWDVLFFFFLFF